MPPIIFLIKCAKVYIQKSIVDQSRYFSRSGNRPLESEPAFKSVMWQSDFVSFVVIVGLFRLAVLCCVRVR